MTKAVTEYAKQHFEALEISKYYHFTEKKQNPKTLRKDLLLVGVEIVHERNASKPIVNLYPIRIIGFCDQGWFSQRVKSPQKKIRAYRKHPIDDEELPELYNRLSKFRKEWQILGEGFYEPPTMVAEYLTTTTRPYILLQAHDDDDGLRWKNGKSDITWFVLTERKE